MSYKISKELWYEVLGINIDENDIYIKNNYIYYAYCRSDNEWINASSNIYELAHKCKKWTFDQGYELFSRIMSNDHQMRGNCLIIRVESDPEYVLKIINANSEPEAIFLACQWILDNKDKQ